MRSVNSPSFFENVSRGAYQGARLGAGVGAYFFGIVTILGAGINYQERAHREAGNNATYPLNREECQIEQLRDLPVCTAEVLTETVAGNAGILIGVPTLCGLVAGAIYGATKSVFSKSHSD